MARGESFASGTTGFAYFMIGGALVDVVGNESTPKQVQVTQIVTLDQSA